MSEKKEVKDVKKEDSVKTEKKDLLGSTIYWAKNVIGEAVSSKKTMFSALSIYLLAKMAIGAMKENTPVAIVALVCATLCFIAWIFCQKNVDVAKISMGKKK